MAKRRPLVVVTRKLPGSVEARMAELFDVRLNHDDHPFSRMELAEALATADVLVPTVTDRIDSPLLAAVGPNLSLIANYGAGVDHIDLATCREMRITVTNTPDVLTEDTADLVMALILMVSRRLSEGERMVRAGAWDGWAPTHHLGRRVGGQSLGIVGMGRIGQAVAARAQGFGLAIHYHNRRPLAHDIELELGATYWPDLDAMLGAMDIVSIHCPLTPQTFHLISARRLKLLKKTAFLINTARGEIVDERILVRMLQAGDLAGAGLDVFDDEPRVNHRFFGLDNVVMLPHLGSNTIECRAAMGQAVLTNIKFHIDGHTPPNRVIESLF